MQPSIIFASPHYLLLTGQLRRTSLAVLGGRYSPYMSQMLFDFRKVQISLVVGSDIAPRTRLSFVPDPADWIINSKKKKNLKKIYRMQSTLQAREGGTSSVMLHIGPSWLAGNARI